MITNVPTDFVCPIDGARLFVNVYPPERNVGYAGEMEGPNCPHAGLHGDPVGRAAYTALVEFLFEHQAFNARMVERAQAVEA